MKAQFRDKWRQSKLPVLPCPLQYDSNILYVCAVSSSHHKEGDDLTLIWCEGNDLFLPWGDFTLQGTFDSVQAHFCLPQLRGRVTVNVS